MCASVNRGDVKMFFYAKVEYFDTRNDVHSRCFGRQLIVMNGGSTVSVPSGGQAYQCVN